MESKKGEKKKERERERGTNESEDGTLEIGMNRRVISLLGSSKGLLGVLDDRLVSSGT
jgi:hypothetical protein